LLTGKRFVKFSLFLEMGDLEKQVVVNGGKEEAEEEEKLLMEGMSVLDFDMLCSTVAMQTQGKYWAKLGSNEEEDDDLNRYNNGGGGGGFRMWEGEVLDCFDDRRIAIESLWYSSLSLSAF
jgi:hypothetical protein